MQTRFLVLLLFSIFLIVDCLPAKHSKKKVKDEDQKDSVNDSEVSSTSDGTSDEEELSALEKIGFKQENVVQSANTSVTQQQLPVVNGQLQPQNNVTNTVYNAYNTVVAGQQPAYNTTQYANTLAAPYNQLQQYDNTNTSYVSPPRPIYNTNTSAGAAYAPQPVYNSTNDPDVPAVLSNQQQPLEVVNKNTTTALSNTTLQAATPSPFTAIMLEEMKCFQKFDNSTKEGQNVTELVEIYEQLHDCLQGKCNYKKAENGLSGCLAEETTTRQEQFVYTNYKCYFNWYELIKKVCTPTHKKLDELDEDEEKDEEKGVE